MKMIKTLWISPYKMLLVLVICLFAGMDTVQAQGCSQPSNLVSNVLSFSKVSLRWSAISGAVNYTWQYRLDNSGAWIDGGTTTSTSTMLTNLLPGRVYTWRVKASCSTYSSVATFNAGGGISGNVDCSAPSNLVHSIVAADSVSLGWSSIVGALNYSVQYRAANTPYWLNVGSVVGTNLALGSLAPGTTYLWRVKASCSVYSSTTTFTLGAATGGGNTGGSTSCSAPSNTNTGVVTSSTAQISWEPQGGAFDYTVQYRLANSNTYVTAGTVTYFSATITGLQAGQNYVWRVKANCSPYGSDVQFSTPGATTGGGTGGGGTGGGGTGGSTSCSAPSNTNTGVVTSTTAQANWEPQGGALDYTVQYRLASSNIYVTVGTVTSVSATITGLQAGQNYVWRVKANCSPYGSDVQFSTLGATTGGGGTGGGGTGGGGTGGGNTGGSTSCSAPSNTNTNVVTSTTAQVSWEPQGGALDYTIQYRLASSNTYVTVGTVTSASATITGLQAGQNYVWRVKANCSPYGSDVQFSTPGATTGGGGTGGGGTGGGGTGGGNTGGSTSCSAPSNTNTDVVTTTTAQVSWESQGGASNYTVQYRLENSTSYITVGTVTSANASITGLQAGREYVWRVKANCSPYGSDVQFSTPFTAASALASSANPSIRQTQLRLFPNPVTKNVLHIQTEEQTGQVFILNGAGQVVLNEIITDQLQTLDVSQLKNGLYFVRVLQSNGKSNTQKLVIAH